MVVHYTFSIHPPSTNNDNLRFLISHALNTSNRLAACASRSSVRQPRGFHLSSRFQFQTNTVTKRPEGMHVVTHVSKKEPFDDRTWDSEEKLPGILPGTAPRAGTCAGNGPGAACRRTRRHAGLTVSRPPTSDARRCTERTEPIRGHRQRHGHALIRRGTRLVVRIRMKRIRGRRLTGPVDMREGRALGSLEAFEPHAQRVLTFYHALRLGARLRILHDVVFVGPAHSLLGRTRGRRTRTQLRSSAANG